MTAKRSAGDRFVCGGHELCGAAVARDMLRSATRLATRCGSDSACRLFSNPEPGPIVLSLNATAAVQLRPAQTAASRRPSRGIGFENRSKTHDPCPGFQGPQRAQPVVSTSAPPRCLDGGDVDLLHRHHRLEGTLCLITTSRKRVG
jgi:hypothetical protein